MEILCYSVIFFFGGRLCLSLIKCSKTILPLCFTEKCWLVCPFFVFFLVFFPNLTRNEQRNSRSAASKGDGRYIAFFPQKSIVSEKPHSNALHTTHHINAIAGEKFPPCSLSSLFCVCVRVRERSENETAKSPRGEMLYLLRTTSQGHSRGQIKLLPASEGVAQNV